MNLNINPILSLKNVKVYFPVSEGLLKKSVNFVKAVDNVSFDIYKGETVGLVGESGSGKTTLSRSIVGLVDELFNFKDTSKIFFEGKNILEMNEKEISDLRKNVQIIFQDPYSSLNPRMSIGKIIEEGLIVNKIGNKLERIEKVKKILECVGLSPEYYDKYAHEFSGGQRQRIGIARSLILNPKLLIADEPVSALDVSIQVQILKLMKKLRNDFSLTFLFVAHDLSVVDYFCDKIIVMYLGKIMEAGSKNDVINKSKHPYTKALLSAVPLPDPMKKKKQIILKGDIPSPINQPTGCVFHTRCPDKIEVCSKKDPPEVLFENGHKCYCWLYGEEK